MNEELREIDEITFGLYSAEEIARMSVCKIDNPKKSGTGTVYDPRMGTTDSSVTCETCKQDAIHCPGHFGHIEFYEPIVHPLFYKRVCSFLNCICTKCNRLTLSETHIQLCGLNKYKGEKRFEQIIEKIKKIDVCCRETGEIDDDGCRKTCGKDHPTFTFNSGECAYYMVYKEGGVKNSIPLSTREILKILDNISDDDVRLMGFDPELVHPRNYIIQNLLVIPPCDRPYVKADGKTCDDDITLQYCEIIKVNNNLNPDNGNEETKDEPKRGRRRKKKFTEQDRVKALASLRFRVHTTFNNGEGKAKHTTNGRAIKCIKKRLVGKHGCIRGNGMGKRCDYTSRTVAGGDPNANIGCLGIPKRVANTLTVPERVTPFNIARLQKLLNENKVDTVIKQNGMITIDIKRFRRGTKVMTGDIIHRGKEKITVTDTNTLLKAGDRVERNGKMLENVKPANRSYTLHIGNVVNRKLQKGDFVLLNRQPSLHAGSMMAVEIYINNSDTFTINLAITKPFNADFDGDELNIHVPQSLEAQAELRELSAVQWKMISAQSSKPNIAVVQDSLLGAYRMTKNNEKIRKEQFFDIAMRLDRSPCSTHKSLSDEGKMSSEEILDRIQHIRKVLRDKGKKVQCFNGKGLVSLCLPIDFNYEKKNDKHSDEPVVRIYRGVMYEGALDKSNLGSSHNAIHQVLNKEYSPEVASHFINSIQVVANHYLLIKGFSIGLGDCLMSKEVNEEGLSKLTQIQDAIQKCYVEAEGIKQTTHHAGIREVRVNACMNKAKDLGLRIAKDALAPENNFISTVMSGSKGDFFNIAQITGLLGQQNIGGNRVPLELNHGRRSLPHYPFGDLPPEAEYESRGFINRGFLLGLNPRQFYYHAMSGREGICDTAMGTATSGYMQRQIVKLTEDIKVHYDGTVRDAPGKIYQLAYGENRINPETTVKVSGAQKVCNVSRLIARLNMKHELELKKAEKVRKKKLSKKSSKIVKTSKCKK